MDGFPAGLRVLVVDDDPTWLKILEKMLKKCSYDVTTCGRATTALGILRERRDRFDIVISDVNMPDMDGFKLLEHVGLEMDLPVIMMSVDGETSRVMKGVQHGACDYLLKPIRMKELRNIWQHVFRKKINEVKEIESHENESNEGSQIFRNGLDDYEDCSKKRKDMGYEEHGDQNFNNYPAAVKKQRVVWSVDLHQKFVSAVNQIGFDKVGPKKILDLMNVPSLTRENVASHLQKYRLYLSRLQRQNEVKSSSGIIQTDFNGKDDSGKFELQSPTKTQQSSPNTFGYSTKQNIVQDVLPGIHDSELKNVVSFMPIKDAKTPLKHDIPVAPKLNSVPQLGVALPFVSMVNDADHTSFGSTIAEQNSWSGNSSAQLLQHLKQDQRTFLPSDGFFGLPPHIQADGVQNNTSANTVTYNFNTNQTGISEVKPLYTEHEQSHVEGLSPTANKTESFPLRLNLEPRRFGAMPVSSASSSTKNQDADKNCVDSWKSHQSMSPNDPPFSAPSRDGLQVHSFQSFDYFENASLDALDLYFNDQSSSITELQSYLLDGYRYNYDYPSDAVDYPVIDEGVFIA